MTDGTEGGAVGPPRAAAARDEPADTAAPGLAPAAAAALRGALAAYLPRQRWAAARGATLEEVRVAGTVPLPLDDAPPATLLLVDASVGGVAARYQLPVARLAAADVDPRAVVDAAGDAVLTDATADARFRHGLLAALAAGRSFDGDGARFTLTPESGAGLVFEHALGAAESRVISAEQSNTSIVYGEGAILKLYRRLEPGAHPDVEITELLSRRDFPHTPRLLGVLRVEDERGTSVAGMAQALVPGAADAWAHALADARAFVGGAASAEPTYGADAARLGAVTRALHDALTAPTDDAGFAPAPAGREDVARWAAGARASVEAGVALLTERLESGALDAIPDDARRVAADLASRADAVLGDVDALADAVGDDAGAAIRHHGDYHLGQVLRGADGGLYVIDFEGEPARPLVARRARHSAARDVAGMLRSFAYAAAMAAMAPADGGAAGDGPPADVRAARAAAWEADARAQFLGAYLRKAAAAERHEAAEAAMRAGAADGTSTYLPLVRAHADALVTIFEIEKLFYELAYELRNRPEWVAIPLAGIARVLGGARAAADER